MQITYTKEEEEKSIMLLPRGEMPDPPERDRLPFFKDPKVKLSLWTILKDSIGKDISKMSVPVYFNQPLSVLQACCQPIEHIGIVDKAITEKNPIRRLALMGCHCAYQHTNVEKFPSKPFNPMLGETFEYIVPG
jgi:oxysterol-binding protein 1